MHFSSVNLEIFQIDVTFFSERAHILYGIEIVPRFGRGRRRIIIMRGSYFQNHLLVVLIVVLRCSSLILIFNMFRMQKLDFTKQREHELTL